MVKRQLRRRPLSKNPGGSLRPRFEPIFFLPVTLVTLAPTAGRDNDES